MNKRKRDTPKRQKRISGQRRKPMSTAVEARIERWIQRQMAVFNVARSFVIAVAIADAAGIDIDGYKR